MSSVEQESQFSPNKHVLKYIFVFKNYTKESHNGGVKQKTSSLKRSVKTLLSPSFQLSINIPHDAIDLKVLFEF